ncbi:MAG TPA: hypothetical protein VIX85_04105 [Acidimicrobiales bacterium]
MEQQRLPLIETSDPESDTGHASPPRKTATVAGTSPPSRRRGAGSPQPSPGTPGTDWRLDEHTRAVGREGVAAARALLNRDNCAA